MHAKLHRRIGTICTNTGCFVDANARAVCRTPRVNLLKLFAFGINDNYKFWRRSYQTKVKGCGIPQPCSQTLTPLFFHVPVSSLRYLNRKRTAIDLCVYAVVRYKDCCRVSVSLHYFRLRRHTIVINPNLNVCVL